MQKLLPILLEGIGRAGKARRASIPARSVSEEQHSQRAQGPQARRGGAAPGHLLRGSVGRVSRGGYTPSLAPRIWPGGAPAKIGSNFCTDPKQSAAALQRRVRGPGLHGGGRLRCRPRALTRRASGCNPIPPRRRPAHRIGTAPNAGGQAHPGPRMACRRIRPRPTGGR